MPTIRELRLTAARVAELLLVHGITRIEQIELEIDLQIHFEGNYTMDPRLSRFQGYETVWTSRGVDWLIYASHEPVIVVAGAWLLAAIKDVWPQWAERISTGWGVDGEFD